MNGLHFDFETLDRRLQETRERVRHLHETAGQPEDEPAATVAELRAALEDFTAAQQTLQAQMKELEQARASIDTERRRYAELFHAAPDAYLVTDVQGMIREANDAAATLLGMNARWLIGRPLSLFIPEGVRYEFRRRVNQVAASRDPQRLDLPIQPRGGEALPAEISISPVAGAEAGDELLWQIHDTSPRRALEAELVNVASRERERIGQDLHDGLNQFAAVGLMLSALRKRLGRSDPDMAAHVEQIHRVLDDAVDETRRLSRAQAPSYLRHADLHRALEQIARAFAPASDLTIELRCPAPCPLPDPACVEHLYRIAQEAVQNAIRHGNARHVVLRVIRYGRDLEMTIVDDGQGVPPEVVVGDGLGLGLKLMRHRAALVGATLDIRHSEPTGTVVTCHLPLPAGPAPSPDADPPGTDLPDES